MFITNLQERIFYRFSHVAIRLANINFWLLLLTDSLLIIASYNIAQYIRFIDAPQPSYHTEPHIQLLIVFIKITSFYGVGIYRGMWRYTSYTDIVNILKGTCVASILSVVILAYLYHFQGFSR